MGIMEIRNGHAGWLVLWLEPLGEDRWLRPEETFRIHGDYHGDELEFSVEAWVDDAYRADGIEQINVAIMNGNCLATKVEDQAGNIIECGHNRPSQIDKRWTSNATSKSGGED
jgi:hypothetical protein